MKKIKRYTGFRDKNGEKIFEGDILYRPRLYWHLEGAYTEEECHIVKWNKNWRKEHAENPYGLNAFYCSTTKIIHRKNNPEWIMLYRPVF